VVFSRPRRWRLRAAIGSLTVLTGAVLATSVAAAPTGPVSATPAANTPQLASTGTTEQVRQLVQCGNTMYAVGSFTSIKRLSTTYSRNNIFSFSAVAPYAVTNWNPNVNGTVNSIAFNGTNCSDAYIGGSFTSVNGTAVKNIAEVDTTTGAVVTTFAHSAAGQVETLLGANGHILVGGYYKTINNSSANPYMTSLNPTTGRDDGFLNLNISGNYAFAGTNNPTRVYNQSLSHSGQYDLVTGDFTSVGGLPRQQIFMLDLSTTPATVTGWTSPEWDGSKGELSASNPGGYPYECATVEPFYLQDASWSPDDSTIYIATTGYHPNGFPTGHYPRTGLCDVAAAFPATINPAQQPNGQPGYVLHNWVNYMGCDSLYSTAADASTAYFAGHERWASNPNGCDFAGPGAINAPGMVGLSPTTGAVTFNPTRGRGLGADDMVVTDEGLWIASDNLNNTQACGGKSGHAGICLLPY
jgi:hypothetical protein